MYAIRDNQTLPQPSDQGFARGITGEGEGVSGADWDRWQNQAHASFRDLG
jgi:hypothetical protein